MAEIEQVLVPDIGDFDAVDVVEVLVAPGDEIAEEDPLITLESDKASMDVPSPRAGVVKEVKVKAGDQVAAGDLILTLEVAAAKAAGESRPEAPTEEPAGAAKEAGGERAPEQEAPEERAGAGGEGGEGEGGEDRGAPPAGEARRERPPIDEEAFFRAYASPSVRRFARQLGVDLGRVKGTGRKGRIVKDDVQRFVKRALSERPSPAEGAGIPPMPEVDFARFGPVEEQPLSRIRKRAAANLHRSWLHVPHVTQHDEADITEMEAFRKAHAEEAKAQGFKLTPVAFLIKASVAALRQHPRFNASLGADGEGVVLKGYYHIGVAVDTEDGLVVPVIRDADTKSLFELARELVETSGRAREGKLRLDDLQGATFSISSLGGIGGTAFTPIVNAPEVAILGVSRAVMKPVWRDGEFVPRLMLPLSLSYDHRVIDGAAAARFTTYLAWVLSDLRRLLL